MDTKQVQGIGNAANESGLDKIEEDELLKFDSGVTAFMFVATAMVQLMIFGLALFYGGLVGANNVTSIMLMCLVSMGLVFCMWVLVGFSLTFGECFISVLGAHLLGSPSTYFMWHKVDIYEPLQKADAVVAAGFPGMIFAAYQGVFAVVAPAIISGAFAGRLHFFPYLLFIAIWVLVVYAPLGFWNWGGGWMYQIGAWDFAGGIVVHESSGFAALAGVLFLGSRSHHSHGFHELKTPHNLPMVVAGTGILWFGWLGFNAGSAMGIGGLASIAFVNTQIAPAIAMMTWVILDKIVNGKATLIGACSGAISGLVAITPGAGFMQPDASFAVGAIGSVTCFIAVYIAERLELDDAVDAFTIHGVGGLCGTILLGVFADPKACADQATAPEWCANPGTVYRSWHQTLIQSICGFSSAAYAFLGTYAILKVLNCLGIVPILAKPSEQSSTDDLHQHGELGYNHPAIQEHYKRMAEEQGNQFKEQVVDEDLDDCSVDSDSQLTTLDDDLDTCSSPLTLSHREGVTRDLMYSNR